MAVPDTYYMAHDVVDSQTAAIRKPHPEPIEGLFGGLSEEMPQDRMKSLFVCRVNLDLLCLIKAIRTHQCPKVS